MSRFILSMQLNAPPIPVVHVSPTISNKQLYLIMKKYSVPTSAARPQPLTTTASPSIIHNDLPSGYRPHSRRH